MKSLSASAYMLQDRYFIYASNVTTSGLWLAAPEFVSLSLKSSEFELGQAVLSVLERSGRTVPHPTEWGGLSTPRLVAAGVKSEKAFNNGARLVTVCRTALGTEIQPTFNGGATGPNRGFTDLLDTTICLDNRTPPLEFGQAIISALALCTHQP